MPAPWRVRGEFAMIVLDHATVNAEIGSLVSCEAQLVASRLVVVIATAGRSELLARTLTSLASCSLPEIYAETLVVENGEKSGVEDVVRKAPPILNARYMHVPVHNKSAALNAALKVLPDCLIVFTDDDARFGTDTLRAYAEITSNLEGNVFFGGPVAIDYIQKPPAWLLKYLPASARGWEPGKQGASGRGWSFLGINWGAFSRDLNNIGGFNEHIGPGSFSVATGQESEAQTRLIRAGCGRQFVPDARVWHFVPPDRCSPEWAIQRSRRQGISLAALLWQRERLTSAAARWLEFSKRLPHLAVSLGRPSAPSEFKIRYVRAYFDGFRHGIRIFRDVSHDSKILAGDPRAG